MLEINISRDYTDSPGGRYIEEGEYSGEDFRDKLLYPKYLEAQRLHEKVHINFDGCYGYGTSCLEEAFGGLVREYKVHDFLKSIELTSTEDETIPDLIRKYVSDAEKKL